MQNVHLLSQPHTATPFLSPQQICVKPRKISYFHSNCSWDATAASPLCENLLWNYKIYLKPWGHTGFYFNNSTTEAWGKKNMETLNAVNMGANVLNQLCSRTFLYWALMTWKYPHLLDSVGNALFKVTWLQASSFSFTARNRISILQILC